MRGVVPFVVLILISLDTLEARTPEKYSLQHSQVKAPTISRVSAAWIPCANLPGLYRACYLWPAGHIILGSEGEPWLRHEIRHHLDWLHNGRLDGSICPKTNIAHYRWSDKDWSEVCAGDTT